MWPSGPQGWSLPPASRPATRPCDPSCSLPRRGAHWFCDGNQGGVPLTLLLHVHIHSVKNSCHSIPGSIIPSAEFGFLVVSTQLLEPFVKMLVVIILSVLRSNFNLRLLNKLFVQRKRVSYSNCQLAYGTPVLTFGLASMTLSE